MLTRRDTTSGQDADGRIPGIETYQREVRGVVAESAQQEASRDLVVHVDRSLCAGIGECEARAPQSFELDETTRSVYRGPHDPEAAVIAAARACPNLAISVKVNGEQIVPPPDFA
jgi:ferredoxin